MADVSLKTCAALFVDKTGSYSLLPYIDLWPIERDARLYSGPLPVVAHPPCQRWGALGMACYARWGGEHNKPGNDGGCFESALKSVRVYGGVLEHPAKTRAFAYYGLPTPTKTGWQKCIDGGWVCEVWQSCYGHKANKATWLYYYGCPAPFELRWEHIKGLYQIGGHDKRGKNKNKQTLNTREANATPIEFRDCLINLALLSNRATSASAETPR